MYDYIDLCGLPLLLRYNVKIGKLVPKCRHSLHEMFKVTEAERVYKYVYCCYDHQMTKKKLYIISGMVDKKRATRMNGIAHM